MDDQNNSNNRIKEIKKQVKKITEFIKEDRILSNELKEEINPILKELDTAINNTEVVQERLQEITDVIINPVGVKIKENSKSNKRLSWIGIFCGITGVFLTWYSIYGFKMTNNINNDIIYGSYIAELYLNFEEQRRIIIQEYANKSLFFSEEYLTQSYFLKKDSLSGKYGFINVNEKWIIKPIFSYAYASVKISSSWGLINKKGDYKIPPNYENVSNVNNGYVLATKNDKAYLFDENFKYVFNFNLKGFRLEVFKKHIKSLNIKNSNLILSEISLHSYENRRKIKVIDIVFINRVMLDKIMLNYAIDRYKYYTN